MIKSIKQGENIGVAKQVQGEVVKIYPHPRFKDMYRFIHKGLDFIEEKRSGDYRSQQLQEV